MRIFKINEHLSVVADYVKTRNGFKHTAKLLRDGRETGDETKINYLNRTWESYEYESVLNKLKDIASLNPEDKAQFGAMIKNRGEESKAEVESQFKTTAMVAQLGDIFGKTQEEKNKWKTRMLKAGLPDLQIPEDWESLSEDEKEKRLNAVIAEAGKTSKKETPMSLPSTMQNRGMGSGWHKEPVSHSYASKFGKAPKNVRGR